MKFRVILTTGGKPMFCLLSLTLTVYLTATGLVTTTALAGRGLVRSVGLAAQGEYREAGVHAWAALATPAVLAQSATTALLLDVLDAARELARPTLESLHPRPQGEKAP
jgi:hypothetical protein